MIRHQHGNEYFLFTQDDHGRFSGALADHFGNQRFVAPEPRKAVLEAVAMHDRGWPVHDHLPTLNDKGLPLHVFETPISITAPVWSESVRLAREVDSYTAFLVSLHVFHLSALSYQHYSDPQHRQRNAKSIFELNKFQQSQIELQEQFRREMGLRTDVPLELGLAPRGNGAAETSLRYNYQLLKAMDQISLGVLCSGRVFTTIEDVAPSPGGDPLEIHVGYPAEWMVSITPWPFDVESIEAEAPFRRVPARAYANVEEFRAIYSAAPRETQVVRVMKSV
ncbi:MAG TPA: DUF3891 family protein [Tepidisphaeraceae bacterium]|jgi:hypothetical protein|nr:DUF3891 family protein [Tepidisphaeraceae bacterium]